MTLISTLEATFDSANESELARKIFREVDGSTLELEVTDDENAHIVFDDGRAQVHSGPAPEDLDSHTISGTRASFIELLEGSTRIVESTWRGDIRAEVYHGRPDLYFALQQAVKIHVPALRPEPF